MNKKHLLQGAFVAGLCILPLSSTEAATSWEHGVIETNHTFTITFSADVKKHEQLIQKVAILTADESVTHTKAMQGNILTLDPVVTLQPSEEYTVEVTLTTGDTYKRTFLTKAEKETPITAFIEKYPSYKEALIILTMEEQLKELNDLQQRGETPPAELQKAVDAIPSQLRKLESIIEDGKKLQQTAAQRVAAATTNEVDLSMQQELLGNLIHTHVTSAPSVETLAALYVTWENVLPLMTATAKANDDGLELTSMLEEVNAAMADFIMATPSPPTSSSASVIKDLKQSFADNLAYVASSETKINAQLRSIETLLDKAADYTMLLEDARLVIEDIELYKQQFVAWKDAKTITNVVPAYNKFQTAIDTIYKAINSTSNYSTLDKALTTATDDTDKAATLLVDAVDKYLELELNKLLTALEKQESYADRNEIYYFGLDSYVNAYDALITIESQYGYYDDFLTWSDVQKAFTEANEAIKAFEKELKSM